ncbi:hypothetical protein OP10G_1174 [Fimbriimonas ginsengisoli Gsoil 348]|uniref:Uncharacterized protein n=2 Tax=Fimbriimonas ginsengisoli TaxID=1005039 RepID=A0A068NMF4_FIMGI|nr:hypothetical protein OP10G_1174 [Fimbriimonas ginsengisoli Gsoil 348]
MGCGGSGGTSLPSDTTPVLQMTGAGGFNGDSSPLNATPADTDFGDLVTAYTRTSGNRKFVLWLPTSQILAGQTIAINGSSTANVLYQEGVGVGMKAWVATAGTATIAAGPDGTLTANLNVNLAAEGPPSSDAVGSLTIQGAFKKMPDPFRPGETKIDIAFSNQSGFSGSSEPFPATATVGAGSTAQHGLRIAVSTAGALARALEAQTDLHNAGESATLSAGNNHDFVVYSETSATETRAWRAVSGTIKVVYEKYHGGKLQLINAHFEPDEGTVSNMATGSFTLNGTLEKG